jgi:hypothetical protein
VAASVAGAQHLSAPASYALAGACLILFLFMLWAVSGLKGYDAPMEETPSSESAKHHPLPLHPTRRRFWYLIFGADDRVSTSKVQVALWTVALAFALLVIVFHDAVYNSRALDSQYVLLLGVPVAAAVSAKAITTSRVANGTTAKIPAAYRAKTLTVALSELVSDDRGDVDLGDAQYLVFNVVALIAFSVAFFRDPSRLPALPDTLVGLTSLSAATYVAKKALPATAAAQTTKGTGSASQLSSAGAAVAESGTVSSSAAGHQDSAGYSNPSRRKFLVAILALFPIMAGWAPAALALHKIWLLPYLFAWSAVIVVLATRRLLTFPTTRPTVPELLFAQLDVAFLPALLGILWLVLYWAVLSVARVIIPGNELHRGEQLAATGLSLAFAAAVNVGSSWSVTRDLGMALYPRWGGNRTRYFYMTLQPQVTVTVSIGAFVLAASVAGAAVLSSSWTSPAVWVVVLAFLVVAAVTLAPQPVRSQPGDPEAEDVQAIGDAFTELGYRVVAYPRLGGADADPFVQQLELFPYSDQRAYAVEIKHGIAGAKPLSWTAGTSLLETARALERAKLAETAASVWPLLVVFDAKADDSLRAFCLRERVSLISIDRTGEELATEIVAYDRLGDVQAIAARLQASAESGVSLRTNSAAARGPSEGGPSGAHLG